MARMEEEERDPTQSNPRETTSVYGVAFRLFFLQPFLLVSYPLSIV